MLQLLKCCFFSELIRLIRDYCLVARINPYTRIGNIRQILVYLSYLVYRRADMTMCNDYVQIQDYMTGLVPERPAEMQEMERYANEHHFPIIGPVAGYYCYQVALMNKARSVFEMGSGYGYSTAWFALAVKENCAKEPGQTRHRLPRGVGCGFIPKSAPAPQEDGARSTGRIPCRRSDSDAEEHTRPVRPDLL